MLDHALAEQLDNPVWFALTGPHASLAEGAGAARRYLLEVSAWCGVEATTEAGWRDLRDVCGPGGVAVLFQGPITEVPDGHQILGAHGCVQMLAPPGLEVPAIEIGEVVDLGSDDVSDMAALVSLTNPGPFFERTVELGGYVGVRIDGELVAMAGQRVRTPGACEISAVCTRADHRGRGLGAALTALVAQRITDRGELPFLHAQSLNTKAIGLYEHLGFETRARPEVTVVRLPD